MGLIKRSVMTMTAIGAAGAIVAAGTLPALAATTSGVRYEAVKYVGVLGGNSTQCTAILLSGAVSTGNPPYVSAVVQNTLAPVCTSWLQNSVNGGPWTDLTPQRSLPGGQSQAHPAWYKTGNYYAGPGTSVRACIEVQAPGKEPDCGAGVSLPASNATLPGAGTPVYYVLDGPGAFKSTGQCFAYRSTSSKAKTSASQVILTVGGEFLAQTCAGWLESSTNGGKTWQRATPTYTVDSTPIEYAFSPPVADGTGQLVRACSRLNATTRCTTGW